MIYNHFIIYVYICNIMIDYCILMVWGANIEASKEKNIFFLQKLLHTSLLYDVDALRYATGKLKFKKEKNTTWIVLENK